MSSLEAVALALPPCLCLGMCGACFYQKDFKLEKHGLVVIGLLPAGGCSATALVLVVAIIACGKGEVVRVALHKNFLMAFLLCVFSLLHRLHLLTRRELSFITASAASLQLLRRPEWIKECLRGVRVATGPLYVLASCMALTQHPGAWQRHVSRMGMAAAIVAGIFLRPDNAEMLRCLKYLGVEMPSAQHRRRWHGMLMLMSLGTLVVLLLTDRSTGRWQGEVSIAGYLILLATMEGLRRIT